MKVFTDTSSTSDGEKASCSYQVQDKAIACTDELQLDSYLHKASNILQRLVRLNGNENPHDLTCGLGSYFKYYSLIPKAYAL